MKNNTPVFKKILVTGGYGTIGSYVPTIFNKSKVILTGKDELDVSKKNHVINQVKKHNPDLIIHLAALTDVDLCEKKKKLAMDINFRGTNHIARVCKTYDLPLVYISTSVVFDGKNSPSVGYTEEDKTAPVNTYGRTKLLGEEIIKKLVNNYLIVRIGWLIGGGIKEKKFIRHVFQKIKNGETVYAVNDIFGTLAYGKDLMKFIKERLDNNEFGLYHFASSGICSRFDMSLQLKTILHSKSRIIPVGVVQFKENFPAPRPKHQVLISIKRPIAKSWQDALTEYVNTELH